jgi:hypothetical protein
MKKKQTLHMRLKHKRAREAAFVEWVNAGPAIPEKTQTLWAAQIERAVNTSIVADVVGKGRARI